MKKIKVYHNNNQVLIRTKIENTEYINERDFQIFQTRLVRGLLRPAKEGTNKIAYYGPDGVTLRQFIKSGITKESFLIIIAQTLEVLKKMKNYGLSSNLLLLHQDYVFVNVMTHDVNFIYQPIVSAYCYGNVFNFFYELVNETRFMVGQDVSFLSRFMNILRGQSVLAIEVIEAFIMQEHPRTYEIVQRQQNGQSENLNSRKFFPARNVESGEEETTLLVEETTLLDEGTTLLESVEPVVENAYIIRCMTNQRYDIRKPSYYIGKDPKTNDCVISNNRAISRQHAKIIRNGNKFYIEDSNSTNGTMLNGQRIMEQSLIENGDCFMLANENFEFYL